MSAAATVSVMAVALLLLLLAFLLSSIPLGLASMVAFGVLFSDFF